MRSNPLARSIRSRENLAQSPALPCSHRRAPLTPKPFAARSINSLAHYLHARLPARALTRRRSDSTAGRARPRNDKRNIPSPSGHKATSGRGPENHRHALLSFLQRQKCWSSIKSPEDAKLGAMYRGDRSRKETLVEYGFRLPSALDNRPLRFDEWEQLAPQTIFVSATPGRMNGSVQDRSSSSSCVRPVWSIRRSRSGRCARRSTTCCRRSTCAQPDERVLITTLTKRMAEDLTEYLDEHGVKVRYLHSDIETVERMEIIRDLRLGKFDVLVGINLLREGLDMPEVSLVAILDADKEGFLRSENSLIQTIGRAARHLNGRAILYADQITGSIQRAMRRDQPPPRKQIEFNERARHHAARHQQGGHGHHGRARTRDGRTRTAAKVAESRAATIRALTPEQVIRRIKKLEQEMFKHARNLEFEEAARMRDEIAQLRKASSGCRTAKAG